MEVNLLVCGTFIIISMQTALHYLC